MGLQWQLKSYLQNAYGKQGQKPGSKTSFKKIKWHISIKLIIHIKWIFSQIILFKHSKKKKNYLLLSISKFRIIKILPLLDYRTMEK